MIICPTVQYLEFEGPEYKGDRFIFEVQVGSRFVGWDRGAQPWGFIIYGRPNGMPLDMEFWTAHRARANHFITMPDGTIFLGVAMTGDFLFLSTRAK